jgi:hypothetical protein
MVVVVTVYVCKCPVVYIAARLYGITITDDGCDSSGSVSL